VWITRQKTRLQELYREFPRPFWTLTGVTLIDQVGGALLYPFFALYFTSRFEVGMTQVGFLFALYAVSSFAGQLIGGALSDRIGRRTLLIFSLATTSTSSLLMGIVESVTLFYALAIFVGGVRRIWTARAPGNSGGFAAGGKTSGGLRDHSSGVQPGDRDRTRDRWLCGKSILSCVIRRRRRHQPDRGLHRMAPYAGDETRARGRRGR